MCVHIANKKHTKFTCSKVFFQKSACLNVVAHKGQTVFIALQYLKVCRSMDEASMNQFMIYSKLIPSHRSLHFALKVFVLVLTLCQETIFLRQINDIRNHFVTFSAMYHNCIFQLEPFCVVVIVQVIYE